MATKGKSNSTASNFQSVSQSELPNGRRGKHHAILARVLEDLDTLGKGRAIKIPLADFSGTVADLRSAINRATTKRRIEVATSSDEQFLYVWKPNGEGPGAD